MDPETDSAAVFVLRKEKYQKSEEFKENAVELLLFNSHDRSKSFSISAGIYRFICSMIKIINLKLKIYSIILY